MSEPAVWTGTITVRRRSAGDAERLVRTLLPEAAREVPRARATVRRAAPEVVQLDIEARDTGALRAALQTYLGWVQLADATELAAADPDP